MIPLRRSSVRVHRAIVARAGFLAFLVTLAFGVALGGWIGERSARFSRANASAFAQRRADAIARVLEAGLSEHRTALTLVASMPSVVERNGAEKAFGTIKRLYPGFESIGLSLKRPGRRHLPRHGPRSRRLTMSGIGGRVTGVLAPDWPVRFVRGRYRLGATAARTTILVGQGGSRTGDAPWPLRPRLPERGTETLEWSDGGDYLTAVRRLGGPDADLSVVNAVPIAIVDANVRRVQVGGIVSGALLGLLAGTVAWIGIARATRRLRLLNASLERRVAERTSATLSAERAFREIFENVPLGLYQCDPEGGFLRVNPSLAATLGYATPEETIAALGSLHALGEPEVRAEFLARVAGATEAREATFAVARSDGRTVWLAERARAVRDEEGTIEFIEGALHDITSRREMEDQLRRVGVTDPLTGLLNRRGLTEAIAAAAAPVSFVALDVDRFKAYNDTFGHPAGDRALQAVADALRATLRKGDVVARAGGEEFVVVLSRTSSVGARRVAEALRTAVAAGGDALEASLTVSVGVATAKTPEEVDEAFAAADRALYMAKETGRNRVVVNPVQLA